MHFFCRCVHAHTVSERPSAGDLQPMLGDSVAHAKGDPTAQTSNLTGGIGNRVRSTRRPSKGADLAMDGVVKSGDMVLRLVIGEKVDLVPANVQSRQVDRPS